MYFPRCYSCTCRHAARAGGAQTVSVAVSGSVQVSEFSKRVCVLIYFPRWG